MKIEWAVTDRPEQGVGWRLEKGVNDRWMTLTTDWSAGIFVDVVGSLGSDYRIAVRGADGIERILGQEIFAPGGELQVAPSPSSGGRVRLLYALPDKLVGDVVQIGVFDTQGRLVRTLASRSVRGQKLAVLTWDGRDGQGGELAAGIYIARPLTAGARSHSARIEIIR